MRITMIGTGYVGLVSGVCFSDFGHDVVCVDKDAAKVARLRDCAGDVMIGRKNVSNPWVFKAVRATSTFHAATKSGAACCKAQPPQDL